MNLRFSAPTDRIVAAQTSCGTVTVTEQDGSEPSPSPSPGAGLGDLLGSTAGMGAAAVLALLVVALLVI